MRRVFADTSYFIAAIAPNDVHHDIALKWSATNLHVITTAWVMTELAAYLSASPSRRLFASAVTSLRNSDTVTFIPPSTELFDLGVELYASRPDKAWSLVDCISFVAMRREGVADALTADKHFVQAGFNALLAD